MTECPQPAPPLWSQAPPPAQRSTWPLVVGSLSITLASLWLLWAVPDSRGLWLAVFASLGVVSVFAGVQLVRRRPSARGLHTLCALGFVVLWILQFIISLTPLVAPQLRTASVRLFLGIWEKPAVYWLVLGAYPVFVLSWMNRSAVVAEVRSWAKRPRAAPVDGSGASEPPAPAGRSAWPIPMAVFSISVAAVTAVGGILPLLLALVCGSWWAAVASGLFVACGLLLLGAGVRLLWRDRYARWFYLAYAILQLGLIGGLVVLSNVISSPSRNMTAETTKGLVLLSAYSFFLLVWFLWPAVAQEMASWSRPAPPSVPPAPAVYYDSDTYPDGSPDAEAEPRPAPLPGPKRDRPPAPRHLG